ncbi:hypothetical protein P43SY_006620 [Pythium insidiosum]|uniref:EF-hand domain-containing protein n=1 Tax=Pythium insidiosum TaxID=114742 RepID=A0AAD5MAV2_PYTIN|nr:hypothetical protein P43SY_006620 [Pythium insidiosum]
MTASRRHRGTGASVPVPAAAAAPAVTTVRLRARGEDRELLVAPTVSVSEVAMCIAAGFGDTREPVALRHATQRVVYSLAMLVRQPQRFTDAAYEVLFQDHDGGEQHVEAEYTDDAVLPTAATTTTKTTTTAGAKRRHHHRRGRRHHNKGSPEFTVGMPEFVGMYDFLLPRGSSMVAETDGEDDRRRDAALLSMGENEEDDADDGHPSMIAHEDEDEIRDEDEDDDVFSEEDDLLRELDLTDFELPQLVHVFTQACPSGHMDRATFSACLEKILSQSGRYDPLARKMFTRIFEIFDADSEGVIDVTEFLGGVSVFASGERDDKIRFTFDLFDTDNDGFITLSEMTKYLTSMLT